LLTLRLVRSSLQVRPLVAFTKGDRVIVPLKLLRLVVVIVELPL
jgi:hypothetical protein